MSNPRKMITAVAVGAALGAALVLPTAASAVAAGDQGARAWVNTMPAPMVTFSFDQTAAMSCDDVLQAVAIGEPVPLSGAPCMESYLLVTDTGAAEDPADALFTDTLVGTAADPDPMACEQVLVGLATGQSMPATVAPCVTAYMLPHSPPMIAGDSEKGDGG